MSNLAMRSFILVFGMTWLTHASANSLSCANVLGGEISSSEIFVAKFEKDNW